MTLSETALSEAIKSLAASVEGEALSRSRVMDSLLDLRLDAATDAPFVIEAIDRALAELPGRTLVPVDWWSERLDEFLLAVDRNPEPA